MDFVSGMDSCERAIIGTAIAFHDLDEHCSGLILEAFNVNLH